MMRAICNLWISLCLLRLASCSDCVVEPEVDTDLSLLQHTARAKSSMSDNDDPEMGVALQVMMQPAEEELLRKYFAKSTKYLEFGSGGSTAAALKYPNLKSIQSVENYPPWVQKMKTRNDVQEAELSGRLKFIVHDIGPVTQYGYPASTGINEGFPVADEFAKENFPKYCKTEDLDMEQLDFVLVDGRFRVNCFLNVLKYAGPDTRIAIHDYFRGIYHIIENFADKVEYAGSLNIFKVHANIDQDELAKTISKYEVVPAL
mmetsp:Transcript_142396/g.246688  ORF Transcript_142396/g.246688 Transcript_142396/m.246688 type:complete len:260 (-) Transcript_142396:211-990(-)